MSYIGDILEFEHPQWYYVVKVIEWDNKKKSFKGEVLKVYRMPEKLTKKYAIGKEVKLYKEAFKPSNYMPTNGLLIEQLFNKLDKIKL